MQRKFYLFFPLLICLFISYPVMASENLPYSGLFVGADFGLINLNNKDVHTEHAVIPGSDNANNVTYSSSPTASTYGMTGGLELGYNYFAWQYLLVGFEAQANFQSLATHVNMALNDFKTGGTRFPFDSSIKLQNDFAVLLKFGALLQPRTLIYGLIGPSWGRFTVNSSASYSETDVNGDTGVVSVFDGSLQSRNTTYQNGLLLGLGMEYLITDCISLGFEYNYVGYRTIHFPNNLSANLLENGAVVSGETITVNDNITPHVDRYVLKLAYYFS